ncbi:MAG: sulfatase [Planctomycetota bacterium]
MRRTPRPSVVVLITIDTLRADAVSFHGEEPGTTPFLQSLAAEGVVFTSAYAPSSWTVPTMASLFTGVAPTSHGVVRGVVVEGDRSPSDPPVHSQPVVPGSFTTLAEAFEHAGYETVGVPSNRHLADYLGFAQGFRQYFGKADFLNADRVNPLVGDHLHRAFGPEWMKTWKKKPAFLWIHYFDPHDPFTPREPWLSQRAPELARSLRDSPANLVMTDLEKRYPEPDQALADKIRPLYYSEISYLDEHLRRLDEALGLRGNEVLLVITADHGEEIVDHGRLGHGHSLHEELVRVPLMIRWPAAVKGGRRIGTPVSLLDVYPTLSELTGIEAPEALQGRSFAPELVRDEKGAARALCFELDRSGAKAAAIFEPPWKLIHQTYPARRIQLFDLKEDPEERHDLSGAEPRIVQDLEARLMKHLNSLPPPPADFVHVRVENESLLEQLKAFGYVGEDPEEGK